METIETDELTLIRLMQELYESEIEEDHVFVLSSGEENGYNEWAWASGLQTLNSFNFRDNNSLHMPC